MTADDDAGGDPTRRREAGGVFDARWWVDDRGVSVGAVAVRDGESWRAYIGVVVLRLDEQFDRERIIVHGVYLAEPDARGLFRSVPRSLRYAASDDL